MTPKEKAQSLIEKYEAVEFCKDFGGMDNELAKQCAMIVVDEVLKVIPEDKKATRAWWGWVKKELEEL